VCGVAQEYAWMRERTAQWGRDGEDKTADNLTALLLDFDDVDGKLHGHCNVAKIIGVVSDEKPDQVC
jgi:hypothetical protein